MSDLFDRLDNLDSGMAKAYKDAVGSKFQGKIDAEEARKLFRKAVDGKRINSKEARALTLILEQGRFTEGAKDVLIKEIKKEKEALYLGTARELSDEELNDVKAALSPGVVGQIEFENLHGHLYLPTHYQTIWKLIMEDEIIVLELNARGLNEAAGLGGANYGSSENELRIYKTVHDKEWQTTVVHEATHAIQDWRDRRGLEVRHVEADAYTAKAIAYHTLKINPGDDLTHPLVCAYYGTAKKVLAKDKKGFKTAYEELLRVVSRRKLYKHKANDERDYSDDRDEGSERAIFNKLHKKLKKSKRK